jgi:hypothetical protein
MNHHSGLVLGTLSPVMMMNVTLSEAEEIYALLSCRAKSRELAAHYTCSLLTTRFLRFVPTHIGTSVAMTCFQSKETVEK